MPYRDQFAVILPAAGVGSRFGGDKLLAEVAGRPILAWAIEAFASRGDVVSVIVVGPRSRADLVADLDVEPGRVRWRGGGKTRLDSVRRGLEIVRGLEHVPGFVAVHDAARPCVSQGLIDRVFAAALADGAAVPGLAVTDTIKRVSGGKVAETPPRAELVAVQPPQAMRSDWAFEAFDGLAPVEIVTDDASVLERAGLPVRVVEGELNNVKVTTPEDLPRVEAILNASAAVAV